MSLTFNIRGICPRLKQNRGEDFEITFDPATSTGENGVCPDGDKIVEAEVTSDPYLSKTTVAVELSCKGCKLFPQGFSASKQRRV